MPKVNIFYSVPLILFNYKRGREENVSKNSIWRVSFVGKE